MFNKVETVYLIGGRDEEKYQGSIKKYNEHHEMYQVQYSKQINGTKYIINNWLYMSDNFNFIDFFKQHRCPTEEVALVVCIGLNRDLISSYAKELNCLFVDFEKAGYPDIDTLLSACLNKNSPLEIEKTALLTKMQLLKTGMQSENSSLCGTPIELINQILQLYIRLNFKTHQPFAFFQPRIEQNLFMSKLLNFAENIKQSFENTQKDFEEGLESFKNNFN